MLVELHIIQNFAPSNLNRDDTGSPKDCVFGGYRRARVSSQCLKRAIRAHVREQNILDADHLAVRTKRVVDEVAGRLESKGKDADVARLVAKIALSGVDISVVDNDKTQYLLYLGEGEIARIADMCAKHWDVLSEIAETVTQEGEEKGKGKKKDKKKAARELVPADIQKQMKEVFGAAKAADLALFGRMLADMPERNIDAACQVAHAISTNEVSMEMDFYTAVDDLRPDDTQGADMMGVVEFNSSCFYRYSVIDFGKLLDNLKEDRELSRATLGAYLKGAIEAVPTGKQNTTAAHNPPIYVRAIAREKGPAWNLANAFISPVRPRRGTDANIGRLSIAALDDHYSQLTRMYGIEAKSDGHSSIFDQESLTVPKLIEKTLEAL